MNIEGCTNVIYFRQYAPYKLCEVADDSLNYIKFLKQQILSELSNLPKLKTYDLGQFVKENSIKLTSPTLLALVSELVSNGRSLRPHSAFPKQFSLIL